MPLWPCIELHQRSLNYPVGVELQPRSSTSGQEFQVSYGMNYATAGPNGNKLTGVLNGTCNVLIV